MRHPHIYIYTRKHIDRIYTTVVVKKKSFITGNGKGR